MMAFTSKVIILLFVSSLAWWQASAEGGSAKTIIKNLNDLTMITNAIDTESDAGHDIDDAFIFYVALHHALKDIVNAFVLGNDRLKTVSDPISDGATVVEAVEILVAAQEKLAKAMVDIFSHLIFAEEVGGTFLELRMAAQDYGETLVKLLLTPSQKVAAGELFRKLGSMLLDAAKRLTPKE